LTQLFGEPKHKMAVLRKIYLTFVLMGFAA